VLGRRWKEIAILFTRHEGWVSMWGLRSFSSWRTLWQPLSGCYRPMATSTLHAFNNGNRTGKRWVTCV